MPLTRTCKVSGKEFIIADEDLIFYEKISPVIGGERFLIPPPTLCPEERKRRRLSWRNLYSLYRSICVYSGKQIISFYAPNRSYKVTDQVIWWSDQVENLSVGRTYDFSRAFTEQFDVLLHDSFLPCLSNTFTTSENSQYVHGTNNVKNCYLVFNAAQCENCEYSESIYDSQNTYDSYFVRDCELCYDSIGIIRCRGCISLEESEDCSDVDFSYYMKGCHDCLLSYGQVNQSYMIANVQYSNEAYFEERKKYLTSHGGYAYGKLSELFERMKGENQMEKTIIYNSENVSGNHISHCYNVHASEDVIDSKNSKFINTIGKGEDCYDCFSWGYTIEKAYENVAVGTNASNIIGSYAVWTDTYDMYYCYTCYACNNCFGCVGLKNKSYCIFNKQYTKEEYGEIVKKIIGNMIRDNEWGEYLCEKISPWGYNETFSNLYFPETQVGAEKIGYQWNSYVSPHPDAVKYIPASLLPDSIEDIPDDILSWAIECEESGKYYKITKSELEFYRKNHLPIPRKHYDVRRKERFERRI